MRRPSITNWVIATAGVATQRNSKLVLAHVVGRRSAANALALMRKLRIATSPEQRFQLTTDGLPAYVGAVDEILSDRRDFAQLIKIFTSPREGEQHYSPGEVVEAVPVVVSGIPIRPYLHIDCRAPKSHDADARATAHPANECV